VYIGPGEKGGRAAKHDVKVPRFCQGFAKVAGSGRLRDSREDSFETLEGPEVSRYIPKENVISISTTGQI